jgi:hypothetical protein
VVGPVVVGPFVVGTVVVGAVGADGVVISADAAVLFVAVVLFVLVVDAVFVVDAVLVVATAFVVDAVIVVVAILDGTGLITGAFVVTAIDGDVAPRTVVTVDAAVVFAPRLTALVGTRMIVVGGLAVELGGVEAELLTDGDLTVVGA